ncbi:MAG: hypothetical protein GY700_06335 [Propionibacteriaceae bacterium]|nr:hypothetical protein [Propionibacteriaceae bacterium]
MSKKLTVAMIGAALVGSAVGGAALLNEAKAGKTVKVLQGGYDVDEDLCARLEEKGGTCEEHFEDVLDRRVEIWLIELDVEDAAAMTWCLGAPDADCPTASKDAAKAARADAKAKKKAAGQ